MNKSLSILDYIRLINRIPSDILTPVQFKILVEIAMDLGENGKTWIKNKKLSINTATKYSSIRAQLNYLKNKCFINMVNEDGKRMTYLYHPTEYFLLRTINKNGKLLMILNNDVNDPLHPLLKEKGKDHIKIKSQLPLGDSLKNHPDLDRIWNKLPMAIRRRVRKYQINQWIIENNGNVGYLEYLINECKDAIKPICKFQDGLKNPHGKFFKKMGSKAVAEQKEHDNDIVKMAEAAIRKKSKTIPDNKTRAMLINNFREAMDGLYDRHSNSAIACMPAYLAYEQNNWSADETNSAAWNG